METIESERLIIKILDGSAVSDEYVNWHNNTNHLKYFSGSGKIFTKEHLLDEVNNGPATKSVFTYGIYWKKSNKLIGYLKLGPILKRHMISDLVTLIGDTDYLGKGLATEAIKLGNKAAFHQHNIRKLSSGIFKRNIASVKAYTKADWVIEGVLHGHYLVDGTPDDRVLVACFNPDYFNMESVTRGGLSLEDIYDEI